MCGIAGFLSVGRCDQIRDSQKILEGMADALIARGPDDFGFWSEDTGIALAHRRLAVLDLSSAGKQPMVCHTGRYIIVFNGEVYNHLDLRKQLEANGVAPAWRGHADTETLLAAFVAWGVRETVGRCIGMFAFAVWDRRERALTLARDRLGEKPLYYGWQGQGHARCFLFGSQVSALKEHPAFSASIDRGALCLLMRHNYIPAPYSIFQGIQKLLPGYLLTISFEKPQPQLVQYWSLEQIAISGATLPFSGSDVHAVDTLEGLLRSSIYQQMIADVPVGAFLSGGIDSSVVVALMQAQSDRPVKTFTIGFEEASYDEAVYARAIAKHLGTDHTELYVSPQQALDVIPRLPYLYDEPFSDSSQIPTFLVSQLTRAHVVVSLSGDGGDELFAGYRRYTLGAQLWSMLRFFPIELRRVFSEMLLWLPPQAWSQVFSIFGKILPRRFRASNMGQKIQKISYLLHARNLNDLHFGLVSHGSSENIVLNAFEPPTFLKGNSPSLLGLDETQRMMVIDSITYLPDDILAKVDRASMGVSLESRVPLLDHRVVEFSWHLPHHMKVRDGMSKWILRQVLYRYVPSSLIDRPKMGFSVPIDHWLRGPLRDWAESLLDVSRLQREAYLNPQLVRNKWSEHLSGRRNWGDYLWSVLMFQAWLETKN